MTKHINFKFTHDALISDDNINVIKFSGDEGISKLFEFTIELKSSNPNLDIDAILESPASLEIRLGDDRRLIQGIVSNFDAVRQINNETIYVATLVPRLWELSLYHTNEVYLEQTITEIIETVLQEAGFTTLDYDISDIEDNDVTTKIWPYKCQYGETHLDFISRLMERDGIYYYFIEGDVGEKIIFCNSLNFQEAIAIPNVLYSPITSLEINALENTVNSFVSQQKRLPYKVLVKDYNDDKPSVDIKGEAIIDDKANKNSEIYVWGQNIETPEEGGVLAQLRAEEFLTTKRTYHGESSVIRMLTGFNFTLKGHFRQSCNQEYVLVAISHEGSNPSALDFNGGTENLAPVYSNSFSAIAADVQYRPAQVTHKPEIHGTLNAFIDAEGDGQYAELDEEGRYRVTMPFDRVNRDGGKSSHWLRMSQPFAGANQGMSFPLRKGGEVLLTFIGGDPDRPVIAGSIPNASQPSITNSDNQTNSLIKTGSGNKIELEDKDGKNRIKLQTGDNKTYMHLGAPNHPGDGWVVITDGMERKEILGGQQVAVKTKILANTATTTYTYTELSPEPNEVFDEVAAFPFVKRDLTTIASSKCGATTVKLTKDEELSGNYIVQRKFGPTYSHGNGPNFVYGVGPTFAFGPSQLVKHWDRDDVNQAAGLVSTMKSYNLSGIAAYGGSTPGNPCPVATVAVAAIPAVTAWENCLKAGEVIVKQTDTFKAQNGNIYDFGGYWNYNLGNSYAENHMDQDKTEINKKEFFDRCDIGGPNYNTIIGASTPFTKLGAPIFEKDKVWVSKSYGDSYSYTRGHTTELFVGTTESCYMGNKLEYVAAATESVFFGNQMSFSLAAKEDITIGLEFGIKMGGGKSLVLGWWNEVNPSAEAKAKKAEQEVVDTYTALINKKINAVNTSIGKVGMRVSAVKSKVAKNTSNIQSNTTKIAKNATAIEKIDTTVINISAQVTNVKVTALQVNTYIFL